MYFKCQQPLPDAWKSDICELCSAMDESNVNEEAKQFYTWAKSQLFNVFNEVTSSYI